MHPTIRSAGSGCNASGFERFGIRGPRSCFTRTRFEIFGRKPVSGARVTPVSLPEAVYVTWRTAFWPPYGFGTRNVHSGSSRHWPSTRKR